MDYDFKLLDIHSKLKEIAKTTLSVETLKTRNSDSLDFYNVAVWQIEDALISASTCR